MANVLAKTDTKKIDVQPIGYGQVLNMVVRTNTVNRQTYDAVTGEFTPDYGLSPLVIFPECQLLDPDSPVKARVVNASLQSFSWQVLTKSGATEIASKSGSTAEGYSVVTSGESLGQITIEKNADIGVRRVLRFKAVWVDTPSGYCYRFTGDIPLVLEDVTDARASITLDMPNTDKWNPFRQQSMRTIKALVMVGPHNFTNNTKVKIFWYRVLNSETRQLISSIDDEENWEITAITKGDNGQITSITVDRDKMGDGISYEVRCSYRTNGNLPSAPQEGDPVASTTLLRCFPAIKADFSSRRVSGTCSSVLLKAIVSDGQGVIPDWENVAYGAWYLRNVTVDANGKVSETRTLLGKGSEITISPDQVKFIDFEVVDRGATVALTDVEGSYLVDGDNRLVEKPILV